MDDREKYPEVTVKDCGGNREAFEKERRYLEGLDDPTRAVVLLVRLDKHRDD